MRDFLPDKDYMEIFLVNKDNISKKILKKENSRHSIDPTIIPDQFKSAYDYIKVNTRMDVFKCHQSSIGMLSLSFKRKYLTPFDILLYMDGIINNIKKIFLQNLL